LKYAGYSLEEDAMSQVVLSLILALLVPATPVAQDSTLGQPRMPSATTLTLYGQAGLEGPSLFLVEDVSNISNSFRTESLKTSGGAWEVCDRINFEGRCRIADGRNMSLNSVGLRAVRSARPVARN
jgi:hypothetical protein